MKKQWGNHGNIFQLTEVSNNHEKLPVGIYKTQFSAKTNSIYLEQTSLKFAFGYKVYGIEDKFIKHVIKTYKHTTGNLGILLNGVKGTGKTVTAQMLCNEMNLPVIIVQSKYEGEILSNFINDIQQDVIIFFDEFEKMFPNYDYSVLTVMDGVLNNEFRKTYLLTTNTSYVNDNMLSRPSRIRYFKTFSDLSLDTILEIIDDKLQQVQFKKELIEFISNLEIITVDIVKSLIEEVNIHEAPPSTFRNIFNIKTSNNLFNVFSIENDIKTIFRENSTSVPKILDSDDNIEPNLIGKELLINKEYIGEIVAVINNQIIVKDEDYDEVTDKEIYKTKILVFESSTKKHKMFNKYAF